MKTDIDNVTLKISLLEVCLGLEPTLSKCKLFASNPQKFQKMLNRTIPGFKEDPDWMQQELTKLRKQKIERKAFYSKKVINKSVKKAKAFATQKITRKLKTTIEEGAKAKLLVQLDGVKSLDIQKLSEIAYNMAIEGLVNPDTVPVQATSEDLLKGHAFQEELTKIQSEMQDFIASVNHNNPIGDNNTRGASKNRRFTNKRDQNAPRQRSNSFSGESMKRRNPRSKMETTIIGSLSDPKATEIEVKKNRPGQRERRKQWEETYGREANHLIGNGTLEGMEDNSKADKIYTKKASKSIEPIHPSWEAKRQLRDKLASSSFQGTKIKFNDPDE